jgi:hypothetical protein
MAVAILIIACWNTVLRVFVKIYLLSKKSCLLFSAYKIESVRFSEMLQTFQQTTRCHIPDVVQPDQPTVLSRSSFVFVAKLFPEFYFLMTFKISKFNYWQN